MKLCRRRGSVKWEIGFAKNEMFAFDVILSVAGGCAYPRFTLGGSWHWLDINDIANTNDVTKDIVRKIGFTVLQTLPYHVFLFFSFENSSDQYSLRIMREFLHTCEILRKYIIFKRNELKVVWRRWGLSVSSQNEVVLILNTKLIFETSLDSPDNHPHFILPILLPLHYLKRKKKERK